MKNILNAGAVSVLLGLLASGCHKEETVRISTANTAAGQTITSDTLSGTVKGTLASGRTYYFHSDIVINQGDTLLMQEGSHLIAIGDGKSTATSPQITCNGTFISIGSPADHNFITVPDAQRSTANIGKGFWGGIQCGPNSGDIILKWTHLEFAGGPAGPAADPAVFASGDPRNVLSYTNVDGNCIIEDCWIYGTTDDGMRILHGKVSIMRNTFEACGKAGGEGLNLKNGTLGDVAYNVSIGAATNGFKISNSGAGPVQTNINLYNNTILNCGFRQVKSGRGGSINYEKGAQGRIYNNVIVNCRFGLRVTP
ncbi:MAG TPA: right-handed parallel beta-helix repeat-containing protein, partial [Chitinophagaceae bacterium]|nr:right-handed parallel beta-helix repeat-containing protein [Chitinophagaceae bacterium]